MFVLQSLRNTALVWQPSSVGNRRMRRGNVGLAWPRLAETFVILAFAAILGMIALQHRAASSWSYAPFRASLGKRLGPARPFTARLSGLPHAPVGTRLTLNGGNMRQILRDIEQEAQGLPAELASRALVRMLDGANPSSLRTAIGLLKEATAKDPSDAIFWSDLAAARLALTEQGFPEEAIQALAAAQRAVLLDPALPEARFNLALALERNSLLHQASRAWSAFQEIERDRDWLAEAQVHLRRLSAPSRLARWERLRRELDAAAERGDKKAVRKIVEPFSDRARAYAEDDLLPQWAAAVAAGRNEEADRTLRIAHEIGEAIAALRSEPMIADSIAAIERITGSRTPQELLSLAAAYRDQAKGANLCRENQGLKGEAPLLAARREFDRARSPASLSTAYHLAVCAYQRTEPKAAVSQLQALLQQPSLSRYPDLLGRIHWMVGLSCMGMAEPGLALDSYQQALRIFQGLGSLPEIGGSYNLLATNQLHLGNWRQSWRYRQRALALIAADGDPRRLFSALDQAADAAAAEGLFEAALRFRDEVVAITSVKADPSGATHAFLHRAEVRFRLGQEKEALQDLQDAKQAYIRITDAAERNRRQADILLVEGKRQAATRPRSALPYLARAFQLYRQADYRIPLVEIYLLRARLLRSLGQTLAAERDLQSGIEEFERQRDQVTNEELRISYFDQARELFDLLIDLQADGSGGAEEAFAMAERQRARVLLDRLKQAGSSGSDSHDVEPLALREVQRRLPEGVTLISYESLPARLLIWVLRKDEEPATLSLPLPAADLEKRISAFLRDVERRTGDEALKARLTSFNRDLLAPVLSHTRPGDLLVFVPDRSLHRLPFAALRDPASGRYLVEDHASVVTPSASLYVSGIERSPASVNSNILVIANPRFDRNRFQTLQDLPGALAEAGALSRIFGSREDVLKEEEATPTALLKEAGSHTFVHLATHALLNSDHPHLSQLVLAPDGSHASGTLTASEISNLSFPDTELVYLGACQSGGGAVSTEGALSLARAFLAAGVPNVVSSLWDVNDAEATRFSIRFYEALLRGERPEEALQAAQLTAFRGEAGSFLRNWISFQLLRRRS
jgi:CHAT domain-containing protein